jgi:membrane associated rhomboid family serine protease
MIPIGDEPSSGIIPIINLAIIITCIGVFFWQASSGINFFRQTIDTYGLVPSEVMRGEQLHTFVSYMFLHGGIIHLLGNMLFLFVFGDNIEDRMGHLRYLIFYLVTGILACVVWVVARPGSNIPVVGASGAISAIMAAYLILFPTAKVQTLVTIGILVWPVKVPAYVMIGLWIVLQIVNNYLNPDTGVAYLAHIGGFIVGFLLTMIMTPKKKSK